MSFCLDTDIIIEFFHGNDTVVNKIKEAINNKEVLNITPITLCELYKGAFLSAHPQKEFEKIEAVLNACFVLDFSPKACNIFGSLAANLAREGKPLDDSDLIIASIALSHHCILVTNNTKHFARIRDLKVENWVR